MEAQLRPNHSVGGKTSIYRKIDCHSDEKTEQPPLFSKVIYHPIEESDP